MMNYVELQFSVKALKTLIRGTLTLNNTGAGRRFSLGPDTYTVEAVDLLPQTDLRNTTPDDFYYFWTEWIGPGSEKIPAHKVEIIQPVRITLSSLLPSPNGPILSDGGTFEGNLIILVDAYQGSDAGFISIGITTFEANSIEPGMRAALTDLLRKIFAPINANRQLPVLLMPGARVSNTSIAVDAARQVVAIRMQIGTSGRVPGNIQNWTQFNAGNFANHLGANDWATLLSVPLVERMVSTQIEDGLQEHANEFRLVSGIGATWIPQGGVPRLVAEWWGDALDACKPWNSDISYHVTAGITLSLPAENMLQTSSYVDWSGNFWDLLGCEFLTGFLGAAVVSTAPFGLVIDAGMGFLIGFVAAVGVASVHTPDLTTSQCTQDDHNQTCSLELPEQSRTIVLRPASKTQPATTLVLNVTGITGAAEGLVLNGSLPLLGLLPQARILKAEAQPFEWVQPVVTCGSIGRGSGSFTRERLAQTVSTMGQVTVSATGSGPLTLQVERISPDPLNLFPPSAIQIAAYQNAYTIQVAARPTPTYDQSPYPLVLHVITNIGSRVINLGIVPPLTDAVLLGMQSAIVQMLSDCSVLADPFWRLTGRMRVKWLVDPPPPDVMRSGRRLWQIEVSGLNPGETLSSFSPNEETLVLGRANRMGIARLRTIADLDEIHLQRSAAWDGTSPGAPTAMMAGKAEFPGVVRTRQIDLTDQAVIQPGAPIQAWDMAHDPAGNGTLVILAGDTLYQYDLSDLAAPSLQQVHPLAGVSGLKLLPQGLLVWGEGGLTRFDLQTHHPTQLVDKPVRALARFAGGWAAALPEGIARLELESGQLELLAEMEEVSSLAASGASLAFLSSGRLFVLRPDESGQMQPQKVRLHERLVRVESSPLMGGPGTVFAAFAEGGLALDLQDPAAPAELARYDSLPWFAGSIASDRLLAWVDADQALHLFSAGASITA